MERGEEEQHHLKRKLLLTDPYLCEESFTLSGETPYGQSEPGCPSPSLKHMSDRGPFLLLCKAPLVS